MEQVNTIPTNKRSVIFFISFIVILIAFLGLFIHQINPNFSSKNFFISVLILFFLLVSITWVIPGDLFSPTIVPIAFLIYYTAGYAWIFTSGLVENLSSRIPIAVLVGLIGYYIGFYSFQILKQSKWKSKYTLFQKFNQKIFWLIIIAFIFIGLTALAILLKPTGYNIFLMGDIIAYRNLLQRLPGWFTIFLNLLKIAAILLIVFGFKYPNITRARRLLVYCSALVIALLTLSTGSRTIFLQLVAYLILLRHFLLKKWSINQIVILGLLGVIMIGGLLYIRQFILASEASKSLQYHLLAQRGVNTNSPISIFLYYLFAHARTGVETFSQVLDKIPSQIPFQFGSFTMQSIRTLLPGKQANPSIFVTDKILGLGTYTEYPPTLFGGLYIDFGLPGIFLGMFSIALVMNWAYIKAKGNSILAKVIYVTLIIEYLLSLYSMFLGSIRPIIDIVLIILSLRFILKKYKQPFDR